MTEALEVLLGEKKLVFQEKLQLINTNKNTLGLFATVLLGLFAGAYRFELDVAFVAFPFVINVFAYYLLSNLNMFNLLCEYLRVLDLEIQKRAECPPLYQASIGVTMATWGFNLSRGRGYLTPSPYYLFGISSTVCVLVLYALGVYRGANYVQRSLGSLAAWAFFVVSISAVFLLMIFTGLFFRNYGRVRADLVALLGRTYHGA